MRLIRRAAALMAIGASISAFAPAAQAAQVGIGVSVGLPGIALVAPGALVVTPAPYAYGYYGRRGYWAGRPVIVGGPYCRGYCRHAVVGRRYWR